MKLVADSRGRLTAADLFRPNTAFDAQRQPDGSIRIIELVEKQVPLVKARRIKGKWVGADIALDKAAIIESLQQDR